MFEHDTWLYHPSEGARLFLAGEAHPGEGWLDHPVEAADPLAKFDHDGDGKPGGSRRRKKD